MGRTFPRPPPRSPELDVWIKPHKTVLPPCQRIGRAVVDGRENPHDTWTAQHVSCRPVGGAICTCPCHDPKSELARKLKTEEAKKR